MFNESLMNYFTARVALKSSNQLQLYSMTIIAPANQERLYSYVTFELVRGSWSGSDAVACVSGGVWSVYSLVWTYSVFNHFWVFMMDSVSSSSATVAGTVQLQCVVFVSWQLSSCLWLYRYYKHYIFSSRVFKRLLSI